MTPRTKLRRGSARFAAMMVAMSLVLSGCAARYASFVSDAALNPPGVEAIGSPRGDTIDLYSIEIGPPPRSAIFFVSGSGCASLSYFLRSYLTGLTGSWQVYAAQKAGVPRSSPGLSCSDEFNDNYNFETLKERNAVALDEVIRRHGEVAGILGVSEGGQIAAELAQANPAVRHLAVIGSGGLSFRELARVLDARKGTDTFQQAFAEVDADPANTRKSVLGYPHRYWSSVLDRSPAPTYLALKIPVLMIFGERDENVPVESARMLEERFRATRAKNFRLVVVPGADHVLLQDGVDRKPDIMTLISAFFRDRPA
ncbi:alpha/beta fold hydrolase [Rhodopseudomonas palustris]|uniref:Alpha/beta hydrolase fold n=1 Tax=Rhodopseudomonas palustris (strain BisB18) TaxID=316056 RepID=Q216U6_RHOPB